jgi:alkylation response protein AidB-like acyl-CoA dehydrogenase
MDVRLSAEQRALRDAAAELVDALGPRSVADLADAERVAKLEAALASTGWRSLREPDEGHGPYASAVEAALVLEQLGRGLADAAFVGPTLAADLRRLAKLPPAETAETIATAPDLSSLAVAGRPATAVDSAGAAVALVLAGRDLAAVTPGLRGEPVDLTRPQAEISDDASAVPLGGAVGREGMARWTALGLALSCADLVGVMCGALDLATGYAKLRKQYGAAIGSYQAVQHLLADAHVAMEGSRSASLHAAWAVDALPADAALTASSVAKAYCGRAALAVCETVIQVHGGIGNTWDCLAHVYLRRALVSLDLLGGVGPSLERVLAGAGHGLC